MIVNKFLVLIAVIILISAGITFLLGWFIKNRFVKYIPAILTGIAGIAFFTKSYFFSRSFEDIGYLIFAMIAAVAFAASIITAVVMEFVHKKTRI